MILQPVTYYLIRFEAGDSGRIDRLYWTHDSELPRGEEYIKSLGKQEIEKLVHGELQESSRQNPTKSDHSGDPRQLFPRSHKLPLAKYCGKQSWKLDLKLTAINNQNLAEYMQ